MDDFRAVFRLLGEVRELGHDRTTWRAHMLRRLCQLTVAGEILRFRSPQQRTLQAVDVGWRSAAKRQIWLRYQREGKHRDPLYQGISLIPGNTVTYTREQLIDDRRWYASSYFAEYQQPAEVDSRIVSLHDVPDKGVVNVITLHRCLRDLPFSEDHRLLVQIFHEELGRLWQLPPLAGPSRNALSPRLLQTLQGLRAGDSEKQIAYKLGLSRHTVHNHVKLLHRRFNVSSRGELLSKAQPDPLRPRLCV